jgi:hypothetical protein
MRYTLGVAVFSGMLGVTFFGIFFTPVFYFVIRWLTARRQTASHGDEHPPAAAAALPPPSEPAVAAVS